MLSWAGQRALRGTLFALVTILIARPVVAIEGAFGLRFDTPLEPQQLGASVEASLLTSLLNDQPEMGPQLSMASWHAFAPQALPIRLRSLRAQMYVQVSPSNTPTWISASFRSNDCNADLIWLRDVLKKKYDQPDLSIRSATPGALFSEHYAERLIFEFNNVVVAAGCGVASTDSPPLQIEYWHRTSAPLLQLAQQQRDDLAEKSAAELNQAAQVLGKIRGRAVASRVASGSRYKIDQVFGLPVARVVKTPGNFVVDEFIDYPLQGVAPPYRGQTARVQLGPTGHLIRFELKIADAQAAEFTRLRDALAQQFSTPTKATRKHVIFNVGADYLILRRRAQQLEFTLISGAGEKGLKSRQLAAQEEQWQAENAGI